MQNAKKYKVIGAMSGTSLDGIDWAYIDFHWKEDHWDYNFLKCTTFPYSDEWKNRLKNAISLKENDLIKLDEEYTEYIAGQYQRFVKEFDIYDVDFLSSHGHTVFHQPEKKITLQIGNLPKLTQLIQKTVVCNFRIHDVQLGGQGAPLVPIGDRGLFGKYDYCINLGGFSNISFEKDNLRLAYDICPVNIVINEFAEKLGLPFDKDGKIAQKGNIHEPLLRDLNNLAFYKQSHPKSLGLEWVQNRIYPIINSYPINTNDIITTFTEHAAIQIADNIHYRNSNTKALFTGGGVYNQHLMNRIRHHQPNVTICVPDKNTIEFKEALIFAYLGLLRRLDSNNVLASVTGAPFDHCSGIIYEP